jgi:hypothetical protein
MMGFGGSPTSLWGWVRFFVACCIEDARGLQEGGNDELL